MKYKKIINLLGNTPNPPSEFRKEKRVEINDGTHEMYNIGSQIKIETSMSRSSLCDYSDACIAVARNCSSPK